MYGAVIGAGLTCSAIGGALGAKLGVLSGNMQAQDTFSEFEAGNNKELNQALGSLKESIIKQINEQPELFAQVEDINAFAMTAIEDKLTQVMVLQSAAKLGLLGSISGLTYGVTSGAISSYLGFGAISSVALSVLLPVGLGLGAAAVYNIQNFNSEEETALAV